jgi:hypothetical protein
MTFLNQYLPSIKKEKKGEAEILENLRTCGYETRRHNRKSRHSGKKSFVADINLR